MADISEVSQNIFMIDNRLFSIPKRGSVYLINETKKVLIECGPTTSIPVVLEGLRELDVQPEDIDYLIVTHIHLDHAGGAGVLIKHLPGAQVIVHPRGVRHLINPARLVAGAEATRGSDVLEMHGNVVPIDMHRIRTVSDGETISLSEQQTLTFIDTPGHAPHHICIYESRNGGLFTGDALAMYIADCDILLSFHPPTQFDLELCLKTFRRLEEFSARTIYYSHFGISHDVNEHIDRARKKLLEWDDIARQAVKENSFADLKERLIENGRACLEPMLKVSSLKPLYDYLYTRSIPMAAEGHTAYYRKILKPD